MILEIDLSFVWVFRKRACCRYGPAGGSGMKKRKILTLLLLFVGTTAFAAEDRVQVASLDKEHALRKHSPPQVIERSEYYEIRGSSEKELRNQMCRNGCTWDDGRTYDSVTSWYWTWGYGAEHDPQTCSTDGFTVTLEITYRFPKWVQTSEAPRPLVDKWDEYMKKLVMHEYGHRDRVLDAASQFSNEVARLPRTTSCDERDQRVESLSSELMTQLNADQREYDIATNHGAKQGALFP